MNKQIVILNGSPRINGNTAALIKSFTKGAQEAGNTVECFNLQQMNIKPCLGCCCGGKDFESPCVQKDDMDKIYPSYRNADIVVLASPLYYWTISGQLKCAIDRLYAPAECKIKSDKRSKQCILIMAAAGNEYEETVYWYEHLMGHMGWKDIGQVLCSGVFRIGDIKDNEKLIDAYNLGLTL